MIGTRYSITRACGRAMGSDGGHPLRHLPPKCVAPPGYHGSNDRAKRTGAHRRHAVMTMLRTVESSAVARLRWAWPRWPQAPGARSIASGAAASSKSNSVPSSTMATACGSGQPSVAKRRPRTRKVGRPSCLPSLVSGRPSANVRKSSSVISGFLFGFDQDDANRALGQWLLAHDFVPAIVTSQRRHSARYHRPYPNSARDPDTYYPAASRPSQSAQARS
jgi:hypothetical protein